MAAERRGRVVRVVEHAPDTRSIFVAPEDGPLGFVAGQFVSCLVPSADGDLIRPYSIASRPGDPELELLLNLVPGGPGSHFLFGRRAGDLLRFTGPWGTFTLGTPPAVETVFVAEETGIAPIRPLVHELAARAPRTPRRLLYGTRREVYRRELAAVPGLAVDVVAPETVFEEAARRWIDAEAGRDRHFFLCGVGPRVLALRDRLRTAGYARRAVQYEKW
jgi:ferredoxin-NADP reductase